MSDLLSLTNTPVPGILVVGGLIFLLLAIGGQITGSVNIPSQGRTTSGFIGFLCLIIGVSLYLLPLFVPPKSLSSQATSQPIIAPSPLLSAPSPQTPSSSPINPTETVSAAKPVIITHNINGTWTGVFVSNGGILYNYRLELTQNGTTVTGTSHATQQSIPSFLVVAKLSGVLNSDTFSFEEYEIVQDSTGVACFITGTLYYSPSQNDVLIGTWQGRVTLNGCPGSGNLELRKQN